MKKVIGGKIYDTETAEEIGGWSNNLGHSDFRNISESLYRTKKGRFFLAGEGGPMTKYSRRCGDSTGGGEDIQPLTHEEAREWAEEHLSPEEFLKIFVAEEA
jgi:hypothetical protein